MKDLLSAVGSGGGAAAAPGAGAAAGGAAAAEEVKEEAKEEGEFYSPACSGGSRTAGGVYRVLTPGAEKEESDEDMGFGLFD